jgi:quinol monooxygenase YgiN
MATLFVRHDVVDFSTWKKAYDEFDAVRSSLGVTGHGCYQSDENPNNVTIYHHFESMDEAKAFMADPRLAEAMMAAGVQGQPEVWFATKT